MVDKNPFSQFVVVKKCHLDVLNDPVIERVEVLGILSKVSDSFPLKCFPSSLVFANQLSQFDEHQQNPQGSEKR